MKAGLHALGLAAALPAAGARAQRLAHPDAVRVSEADRARIRRLRGRAPEELYPAAARRERIDGYVTVDLLINAEGFVVEASVVSESPPGAGFGLAALDVTKTWEFDNGLGRLVLMEVPVSFLP